MLRIRLQRTGRKHEPTFRLVLTESTNSTKSGKFSDILGSYDPRSKKVQFNAEKIKAWIEKGARVTDTVHNLLINQNIISGKKINVLPKKTPPVVEKKEETKAETKPAETETSVSEPVSEEAPALEEETPVEVASEEVKEEWKVE